MPLSCDVVSGAAPTVLAVLVGVLALRVFFQTVLRKKVVRLPLPTVVPFAAASAKRDPTQLTVLVTGGAGFLGSYIVNELLKSERVKKIVVTDLQTKPLVKLPEITKELSSSKLEYRRMSVTEEQEVMKAVGDTRPDVVIHTANLVCLLPEPDLMWNVNVVGTQNVLNACRKFGVSAVVYTSSSTVTVGSVPVINGIEQTTPYADVHIWYVTEALHPRGMLLPCFFKTLVACSEYSRTKAAAEQLVLLSNGDNMETSALRFPGIYGYGDRFVYNSLCEKQAPSISAIAQQDFVYVMNAADAHVKAALALIDNKHGVAGNAFFITDECPMLTSDFQKALGHGVLGDAYHRRTIPCWFAKCLAVVSEFLYWLTAGSVYPNADFFVMNRSILFYVLESYTYSTEKARRLLGYRPRWNVHTAPDHINEMKAFAGPRNVS